MVKPARRGARGDLFGRTLEGLLWAGGGKAGNLVLQMIAVMVLARLLTPADFGVVGIALVVTGFASVLSQLGIGPAIVQHPDLRAEHESTGLLISVAFSSFIGLLVWLAAGPVAQFFDHEGVAPILRALAPIFPLYGIAVVSESLIQRELGFRSLALRETLSYGLGFAVVGIVLARLGFGLWALVAATITQVVVRTAVVVAARRPRWAGWSPRAARELAAYGGGQTVAKVANYGAGQGDNLVVGRVLGAEALGFYSQAYQMMALPASLVGQVLNQVLFPVMASIQGESARLGRAYLRAMACTAYLVLPISVVSWVFAPEIVAVVLGPRWEQVVLPFRVLAVGMLFRTSYKLGDALARATGAVYRRAWRQVVFAGLVVGGAYLGRGMGLLGSSLGVLLALAINFMMTAQLSLSMVGASWGRFASAHAPGVAVGVVAAGAALGAKLLADVVGLGDLLTLALGVMAAGSACLVAAVALPAVFLGADVAWARARIVDRLGVAPTNGEPIGDPLETGSIT
jgi:O-antigen/teichoic acid export membrane protein